MRWVSVNTNLSGKANENDDGFAFLMMMVMMMVVMMMTTDRSNHEIDFV
jgi:hypothetical protein